MAVQKEIWIRDIAEKLFAGVEFANRSLNHSMYIDGKTVHIPQAGAAPNAVKNRTQLPASISKRTDTDLSYNVNSFTTDPILVQDIEEIQTEYDKRESVLRTHIDVMNENLGNEILHAWAGSLTNTVLTSGADSADALAPAATGERKKLTPADVRNAAKALDKQNVPQAGRVLVLPVDMYYQLFDDASMVNTNNIGNVTLPTGVINKLFGFDIYVRGTVNRATSGGNLKAVSANGAAGDKLVALAYHPSFVAKAVGDIKVFADDDKPEYYGSVMSAEVLCGASKMFTNETGIVSILQDAAAGA